MIFSLIIIHNHVRMSSSTTRILHITTWVYFTEQLAARFIYSPEVVKEEIMTAINDLVQEFLTTSSDEAVGAPFFAMRSLLEILQRCLNILEVRFDITSVFVTAIDLADKIPQRSTNPRSWQYLAAESLDDRIRAKFIILLDGYQKMIDQSFSKLGDMIRFQPGVVVQKHLSMQGMADLYSNTDSLERVIKSIEPLRPTFFLDLYPSFILDGYLSGLLQDRDRSQLYDCDPELQHICICRQYFLYWIDPMFFIFSRKFFFLICALIFLILKF